MKLNTLILTIILFILLIAILPDIYPVKGLTKIKNIENENNNSNFIKSVKRVILVSDTHWGGKEYDGIAGDDIQDFIKCMKYLNPDYLLHLGDITELGLKAEFTQARENFTDIIESTNINHIWSTGGGSHDGLVSYIPLENFFHLGSIARFFFEMFTSNRIGEKIHKILCLLTQNFRYKFCLGFYQILNQTSQWYTLKIGNNVFVMVGYFHQPATWSSGNYSGDDEANLLNMNKVNWLNATLAKWNGTGNNIFICHHFPLYHTNIYTDSWAGMYDDRFQYESQIITNMLSNYTDVVAWFSGHVHVDSNATYSSELATSKGTAVSGASRHHLPDHVHFINCGNIWKEHGKAYPSISTFSNFRYLDLKENQNFVAINAWDSTNNRSATMTVNDTDREVSEYIIELPYAIKNINDPITYEQGWDVYEYSEYRYAWYQDNEGLLRNLDGWIESRWDFWEIKDFSNASLNVDTSNQDALSHLIYYSNDGMNTWSNNWYTSFNLTSMPPARWVKIITNINTNSDVFIRDISFNFL